MAQDFLPKLKANALSRIQGHGSAGDEHNYSADDLMRVRFQNDCIYPHATVAFNYTTYDVRRDQDTINVNTGRSTVLLHANEDDPEGHPFWYARVLKVYHVNVMHISLDRPKRMEFLWVRWFGLDAEWDSGPSHLRLDRIGYVPDDDPDAFGFLDPDHVLRACHLIPSFAMGRTPLLLTPSTARDDSRLGDWTNYYVNRSVPYCGTSLKHSFYLSIDLLTVI
jgi:hypothetical protein